MALESLYLTRLAHSTRPALFLLSFVIAVFHSSVIIRAQEPVPSDEVVYVRTDLITVPLVVLDRRGRRVAGLRKQDFRLLDQGKPVEISYFAAGTDRVALLFLLDASGSTREILTQQRETSLGLLSRFGPSSSIAIVHFRERAELVQPFTTDIRKARAAFNPASIPDRLTAIFDAALHSVRVFASTKQDPTERRIVILISDGLDTASNTQSKLVIDEANKLGISFYVLHLPLYAPSNGRLVARRTAKGFRELAEKTGGQFFVLGDAASSLDPRAEYDLRPIYAHIADDLLGQYVLGFHADQRERNNVPRTLAVRVTGSSRERLRIRQYRSSYVLPP